MFGWQFLDLGQQFLCLGDGVFFEVVVEGLVVKYFKEGVVVCGVVDLVQVVVFVVGMQVVLDIGSVYVVVFFCVQEYVFELYYVGVGEQQGWIIVWYQWC